MDTAKHQLIPRDLSWRKVKTVLFPEQYPQAIPMQELFRQQAASSLFLIMLLATVLSITIILFGINTNIDILHFSKSLIGLLAFFVIVLIIHKVQPFSQTDYYLLLLTIFFIASWGVAKDIINFNFFFNKQDLQSYI